MTKSTAGGTPKKTMFVVPQRLLDQVDNRVVPILRLSGRKFQRSELVRALLELSVAAAELIQVEEISDFETLKRQLRAAISHLDDAAL